MKDLKYHEFHSKLQYESPYRNHSDSLHFVTNYKTLKARKKLTNSGRNHTEPSLVFHLSNFGSSRNRKHLTRHVSMPQITRKNGSKKKAKLRTKSSNAIPQRTNLSYSTKYIVSEHRFKYNLNRKSIINQTNFKVYRCQVAPGVAEDCHKCCCSCNSDVLFEVMKDLYDCYKKRDCDNCNCILCCNLPEHDRSGMIKKSAPTIGLEAALKELAMKGFALPEGKTDSEKALMSKIRYNLGLPPEPKTDEMRAKYTDAANAGLMLPLEKKTLAEKEKILKDLANMAIPLPEGRTPSEKSLIAKIKGGTGTPLTTVSPSEKMRRAKSAGLLTPWEGKSPDKIEKILRGLAMRGIPLPQGKTPSKKKLINKVRLDLGLPPEPKTSAMRDKHTKAAKIGLLLPLEGKTPAQKEKILHGLNNMGIPLPVGRTPSEKALIAKIKAEAKRPSTTSTEKTSPSKPSLPSPLDGKTMEQKEAILKDLAMKGVPLPAGKTDSEKNLINKVRFDLGLPPEPKNSAMRDKHVKAAEAGILLPLEGKPLKEKERILRGLADMRIPLPKGRTPSEKSLIGKIKLESREPIMSPEKLRKAKAAGLLTPLEGKTPEQKEKILRGLAMQGIPLPEGKTKSEKDLLNKVRADLGLPPEPKTPSMKEKHARAADAGQLLPLEGKSLKEKEKILQGYVEAGIHLPEGRTPSEKALIAKAKPETRGPIATLLSAASVRPPSITTEKLRKAKAAGLLTPLAGKPSKEKEKILRNIAKAGLPLPTGRTPSEVALIKQIKKDFDIREDTPEEKIRKAKAAGYLTPLEGKTPEQREVILRGRAAAGLPLPEGTSPSERELIKRIKAEAGYITPSPSERLRKAQAAGLITPLKGKTPSRREKILKDMLAAGVPIPEGTTPSEKEIISKVIGPQVTKSKKLKAAKAAGLLTPLAGKSPEKKEKILKGLAKLGLPLPVPSTPSEKNLVDKVRAEMGLPPEPKSRSLRERYEKAHDAGIMTPLEGKSPEEKEKLLRRLQSAGIPLPIGRTRSEKSMIKRVKAGLATPKKPFDEMTPEEKVKRLKHLVKAGRPLPEAKSPSAQALIDKVRMDMGLPPAAKTESMKLKIRKAYDAGLIIPLEGKTEEQKSKILSRLAKAGIPLPEGRTASEKAMIRKIQAKYKKSAPGAPAKIPSQMLVKAKELGLLTPLKGKPPEEKERILKGLAAQGLPLPEATSPSEKQLIEKIRKELGLPPEPTTMSMKERYNRAAAAGILVPLEGLSESDKIEKLRALAGMDIPLPEGRTASEKKLVEMVNAETSTDMKMLEKGMSGILTPLAGKTHEEKEKILRGLADAGLPLPKGETKSERILIRKIKAEYGIPVHARTASQKEMIRKAKEKGLFTPLTGKKTVEKERIIRGLAEAGLPLPEGKTATEKEIIKRVKAELKIEEGGRVAESEALVSSKSTCERACGCGKKKIKFKHSYVKISIISPDISSICPCPDECIPGVKGGIYAGSKGINVVIERAIGIPKYPTLHHNIKLEYKESKSSNALGNKSRSDVKVIFDKNHNDQKKTYKHRNLDSYNNDYIINTPSHTSKYKENHIGSYEYDYETDYNYSDANIPSYVVETDSSKSSDIFDITSNYTIATRSAEPSFESVLYIKSETSLSFSISGDDDNTESIIFCTDSGHTLNFTPCLQLPRDSNSSDSSIANERFYINRDDYYIVDSITRSDQEFTGDSIIINNLKEHKSKYSTWRQDDDFQIFQMSARQLNNIPETHSQSTLVTKTGQPVVVINNLNSDIDVTAVVDEILSKKEFSDASSLFVIVPTSDDEDICDAPDDSATCFQLSKNFNKWNCTDEEELCLPHRKTTSKVPGLRVSAKGRRFFLEGVPAAAVTPNNKETMFAYAPRNHNRETDSKLCQMNSMDIINENHVVSTDTTQDRPCCCCRGQTDSFDSYKDRCIMNVLSEVITPLMNNQGIDSEALSTPTPSSPTARPQPKYQPLITSNTSVSVCQVPPCGRPRTHFSDAEPGHGASKLPQELLALKKILEQKCSPETIKELCEQMKAMNAKNAGGCGMRQAPINGPNIYTPPAFLPPPPPPSSSPGDEICPACFKPKYKDGKILKCACSGKKKTVRMRSLCPCEQHQWPMSRIQIGPKTGTRSVGCQCCICDESQPLGPQGQIITKLGKVTPTCNGPPVSIGIQDGPGSIITPKGGYRFGGKMQPAIPNPPPMGFFGQPCLDREMGQIEICGPAGGCCMICPGGTYAQAGMEQMRYSLGIGTEIGNVATESSSRKKKNCACADKKGKKKGKVICECPPEPEQEPEPEVEAEKAGAWPDLDDLTPEPTSLNYLEYYGDYLKNRIEMHRRKIQQMRSDLTQTTSGFKFNKKKRPRSEFEDLEDSDVSVEDAIRYYALINPEMLREILPSEVLRPKDECVCEDAKAVNTVECECPEEMLTEEQKAAAAAAKAAAAAAAEGALLPPPEIPEEDILNKGLKLRMPGKGSGSKGLTGICCFDMMEQRPKR